MLIMLFLLRQSFQEKQGFWEHFDCSVCPGCDFVKKIPFGFFFFFHIYLLSINDYFACLLPWEYYSGVQSQVRCADTICCHSWILTFIVFIFLRSKGTWKGNLSLFSVSTYIFTFYRHNIKEHIFCRHRCWRQRTVKYWCLCISVPAVFTPYFLYHWFILICNFTKASAVVMISIF